MKLNYGEYEVSFDITREDFWQLGKYYLRQRWRGGRLIIFGLIGASIGALSGFLNLPLPLSVLNVALYLCLLLLTLVLVLGKVVIKRVPSDKGSILGRRTIKIDQNGIHERTTAGETNMIWAGVHEVARNKDYLFIFLDTHMAYMIPRRAFVSQAASEAFFNAATSYWKDTRTENKV